jgi:muramidase (phage lysozyme)
MNAGISLIIALAGAGGTYWALKQYTAETTTTQTAQIIPASVVVEQPSSGNSGIDKLQTWLPVVTGLIDVFGGSNNTNTNSGISGVTDVLSGLGVNLPNLDGLPGMAPTGGTSAGSGNTAPLRSLIRSLEAPQGYNQIYGGISTSDYPSIPVTQMTVGQVLDWQDSIDSKYPSEATGGYQFMEDTLRGLVSSGVASKSELFSPAVQERLATALMVKRGLNNYIAGSISDVTFAQNLSKEWASLPAQTKDRKGRAATGQSYYAGDGLNKSHTTMQAVLNAVRAI